MRPATGPSSAGHIPDSSAPSTRIVRGAIPATWLFAFLASWLCGSQLLLWRFLDAMPLWAYGAGLLLGASLIRMLLTVTVPSAMRAEVRWTTLLLCLTAALVLLMLGGEGRFFYANIDWQVRDAVLRDMAVHPWPFVYTARETADVLRAPIGMFLLPSLLFKLAGPRAGDLTLLVQNALLLGSTLALGSCLFRSSRSRIVALFVVILFSGFDVIGQWLMNGTINEHMEGWSFGLQFSSAITLAFWVPQHAIAGWIAAAGFLLWRAGHIRLGAFLALLPLTALWSPLAMAGAMPFAAFAGITELSRRQLRLADVAMPAIATILTVPTLLYLGAANHEVGVRPYPIQPLQYMLFQALETLPWLVPLILGSNRTTQDRSLLALVGLTLIIIPYVQIGWSIDFMMRGSIPALAILAYLVAQRLMLAGDGRPDFVKPWLVLALLIGSITGLSEAGRALLHAPSPRGSCSFFKAWDQSFSAFPKGSYLAPLDEMPALIRPPAPQRAPNGEPARCWSGEWYRPTGV